MIFPLTRNLLLVTKDVQSVCSDFGFGSVVDLSPDSAVKSLWADLWESPPPDHRMLMHMITLMIQIANRELTRRAEIETALDYISRELARVKVAGKFVAGGADCLGLGYRAMDIRSAVLNFLAIHIRRHSNAFGIIGNVHNTTLSADEGNIVTTLVKGDMDCEAATQDLQAAVTEFNSALILLNASLAFHATKQLRHIDNKVDEIALHVKGEPSNANDYLIAVLGEASSSELVRNKRITGVDDKYLVPFEKNEHFIGRRSLLAKLCETLCTTKPKRYNHRVALHGLGGVGKTQLALEYVYTHKTLHDRIYWINGANQASLLSGYQEIGKRVGCIMSRGEVTPSEVAKAVVSWLNKEQGWLLVIDNVDDWSIMDGYLPERSPWQLTLLTTRNPNSDEIAAEAFEVEVLDKDDAVDLLLTRAANEVYDDTQVKEEAEDIVHEVGCLPLAIEQAAAYIREVSKDIFKFLPSYRKNRKRHHTRTPKGHWKYGESIASTWHLSFKQVEENSKAASRLLQLLAFLDPDCIYPDFLEAGNDALEPDLKAMINDPDTFDEALFELERFSLIRRQRCEGTIRITIHRLVQLVIVDEMDQSERQNMMMQIIRLGISAFPDATDLTANPSSLELSRRYRSQVLACLRHSELEGSDIWQALSVQVAAFLYFDGYYEDCARLSSATMEARKIYRGPDDLETLQSMHRLALALRKLARPDEAISLFQETVASRTRILGLENIETLQSMHGLGWALADLAKYQAAATLHQESLTIKRKILQDGHPETIESMDGLAWAYWRLGDYHKALALHEEALELRKNSQGVAHVDTLSSMDGLGWAKWRVGSYEEAAQLFRDSLDLRKAFQREDHPDIVSSMDGLAWAYWRLGQYHKAFSIFQEMLELNKRILGPEHPDTGMNLYGLGWGHLRLGRYTNAINSFQEAHAITTRILGHEHPDALLNADGLAWCHWSLGDYDKARDLHQENLESYKRTLGSDHSDTMFSLYGLGCAQLALGNYDEAESLFKERLAICSSSLQPDHRDTLMSKNGLASTYEKAGRYEEAVVLFSETLKKRKEVLAPAHPEILESMDGLATAYRGMGRTQESLELFRETLQLRKAAFGDDHPDTLQTLHGLAISLHETGQCEEAAEFLINAWRGRERILGENHPETMRSMEILERCYRDRGHLNQADQLILDISARHKHRPTRGDEAIATQETQDNFG